MSYRILRTDKASDQLYDLIRYIAAEASVDTALGYLDKLESAIMHMKDFSLSGTVPPLFHFEKARVPCSDRGAASRVLQGG